MGACCISSPHERLVRDYFDKLGDNRSRVGDYERFSQAVQCMDNDYSAKNEGTVIKAIKNAVAVSGDGYSLYIISGEFSDGNTKSYRIMFHENGLTTVDTQS